MTLGSALLLGTYDVLKKKALQANDALWILLGSTVLSSLFLSPFLELGQLNDHLRLVLKAFIVSTSWISGMIALKLLPITTASTLKASRPFFVVVFSIILFHERLNVWQWGGVMLALFALTMLSVSSKREGIKFSHSAGVAAMMVSILSGVISALYDKHIIKDIAPLFVQSWTNIYISIILAVCVLVMALKEGKARKHFHWDATIVLIAIFITGADMLYFFALKQEGSLLSVVSLLRRCSVIVTFALGSVIFKEHRIKEKAVSLGILLVAMAMLLFGS